MKQDFLSFHTLINGIKQYFIIYPATQKTDTAVIYLHGGPGESNAHFLYLSCPEHRSYHFVYYDQRGTGKTQMQNKHKAKDVTIDTLIEDLYATIQYVTRQCQVQKIILLGHSWGTVLAVHYLQKYPTSVSAYIGMGQVVSLLKGERVAYEHCLEIVKQADQKKDLEKMEQLNNYPGNRLSVEALKAFRQIQMKYHLAGIQGGTKRMLHLMRKSPIFSWKDLLVMSSSMKVNQNLMDTVFTFDCSSYLTFSIPVYFICGRQDWQVPSVLVKEYYEQITAPDKDLFWIENAGHSIDLEAPEAYNQVLETIVTKVRK